jgi:hypothetical protein
MKQSKHKLSIEEQLQNIRDHPPKKKKLNGPRKNKIEGFVKLEDDQEVCLTNSDLKTEFHFPKRKPTS